jgi:Fur family ferric uptake transcriptional regulator
MTFAPRSEPLVFDDLDDVAAELRRRGGRLSASRRLVLEALFAAEGPVSADYIASGCAGRATPIEATSVYRALERLEALGVVRHVHLGHGPGLYALTSRSPREYVVCDGCGRIESVEGSRLDRVRSALREEIGYDAQFSHFPIHGLCARCARRRPPTRRGAMTREDEHAHDTPHSHEHRHGDVTHSHPHDRHDHDHTEHDHEHSHGDYVHSHPHVHEAGLEGEHEHSHD